MMNRTLIKQTVELVSVLYEAERICESNASIEKRAINWYQHTDITDVEILTAAVWLGDYSTSIDYDVILATRDMLFPPIPFEYTEIHIGEIEAALRY